MYCSGLGALYGGAGVWPLLLPRASPHFAHTLDPARHTPPRDGNDVQSISIFLHLLHWVNVVLCINNNAPNNSHFLEEHFLEIQNKFLNSHLLQISYFS